jgi:hypothetical protein
LADLIAWAADLGLLQSSLMENICQLEGLSGSLNVDVSPSTVKDQIPEALMYACVNWASHVANITSGGEVAREVWDALYSFFDEKLLQWFECLGIFSSDYFSAYSETRSIQHKYSLKFYNNSSSES